MKFNLPFLIEAFSDKSSEQLRYLDTQTGEILVQKADDTKMRDEISKDFKRRYLRIEPFPAKVEYQIMEIFVKHLPECALKRQLIKDLRQEEGVFSAFRNTLSKNETLFDRWEIFHRQSIGKLIKRWLAENSM